MPEEDDLRRRVMDGYDGLADAYAAQRDAGADDPDLLARLLSDLPEGARVLDAGCGAGDLVLDSLPAGATGVGIDISREQVERAREHAAVARADMTRLPFPSSAFDAATAMYSVIHVPASDHGQFYAELARVLRPGGDAVVVTGHDAWTGANADWLDAGVEMAWSWPDLEDTRDLVRDAGLEIRAEEDVGDSLGGEFRHLRLRQS
ncbi:class I SAM-dependent methyltransferase [Salarchaeum japonicum]|uniref:Class I SAM-dependent methyltransferase n=1 Tax=Salarchaeum japonicum TaxID=555573 RepID=A0AAV3T2Q0_9EURY|nr:class I SAM-dependent methyltransferase [Salarchaeum japonicum]